MNSDNYEINSEALKHYRNTMGCSQKELAGRIGVTPNTVYRWEKGGEFKVRQSHQKQLSATLGVSLKQLREPVPAHKLKALENLDPRTNSTISETANMALEIVSETYHINKDAIMDIAPFMFHAVAAASLGRRAVKLDEMDKEVEKVREICLEKLPYSGGLFIEDSMTGGSLSEEQDAINNNQLFFSDKISDDVNDISTNPFSLFLKSFIDLMPEKLSGLFEVEWRNDELPRYHITESFIRDILLIPVDEDLLKQIMELVLNGSMPLKEINYRASAGWMSNEFMEEHREDIINVIKELVAEKHAAHQTSNQPASGEDQ